MALGGGLLRHGVSAEDLRGGGIFGQSRAGIELARALELYVARARCSKLSTSLYGTMPLYVGSDLRECSGYRASYNQGLTNNHLICTYISYFIL